MTKKIHKGFVSLIATAMLATFMLPLSASAGDLSETYNGSFASDFSFSKSADSGNATLVYGFNTVAINEDIAWANHNLYSHYASLTNGNGVHNGPIKPPGEWSKIEVTHSGTSVTYHCYW
jgi:hypothetical protein